MTHTLGPWRWFDYPDGRKLLAANSRAVIHCPDAPMTCEPADQRLIAAAPDLLAALKTVVETGDDCPMCDRGRLRNPEKTHWPECPFGRAHAVIAKAEGRTESVTS
jgi:hypothetical protein